MGKKRSPMVRGTDHRGTPSFPVEPTVPIPEPHVSVTSRRFGVDISRGTVGVDSALVEAATATAARAAPGVGHASGSPSGAFCVWIEKWDEVT